MLDILIKTILVYIPETFLVIFVGPALLGMCLSKRELLRIGSLSSIAAVFFIEGPVPRGWHTLVLTVIYAGLIWVLARKPFIKAFGAMLLSTSFLILSNVLVIGPIVTAFNLSLDVIMPNPWLHSVFGLLESSILIAFTVGHIKKTKRQSMKL